MHKALRAMGVRALHFVIAAVGVGVTTAPAQELASPRAGPRFLLTVEGRAAPVEAEINSVPLLRRRLSLSVEQKPLAEALKTIQRAAGVEFVYSPGVINPAKRVSLQAGNMTVAAVLTDLLVDAQVDVLLSGGKYLTLVPREPRAAQQAGEINGRVTDAKSGEALGAAEVFLEGTRWRSSTGSDGRYRIVDVAPGNYTLAVRRLGYGKQNRVVVVAEGAEVTVEVALQPVATQLNEIVTTVTGDQRRVELGHVVGRIDADSVAKEAPVSTLSELLTGRVPGLQVFQAQGTVGGRTTLQIRGPNSFSLKNEPVVIVDGVRYTTAERQALRCCSYSSNVEASSPLNDLNINDIESIEVVKGPSAATLYGTDAANGVLVITTKRGRPGPARWNGYAKTTTTEIRTEDLRDIYWGWGTVAGVPNNPNLSCTLARVAAGQCTRQDSVTIIRNPLKDPQYSIFTTQPAWEYGLSVAGGQQSLRYYVSADFRDATGPLRMPPALAEALQAQRGLPELPRTWQEPNKLTNLNLRSNVSVGLGETAELRLNTGYLRSATNALSFDGILAYVRAGSLATPAQPTQPYGLNGFNNPAETFAREATEDVDRFVGSASGEWRPVGWLATRATLGLDLLSSHSYGLVRPGDQPGNVLTRNGSVEDTRTRQVATTAELGATVTARRRRLSARTAVGAQYVRTLSDASGSFGDGLAPGASVVPGAVTVTSAAAYRETAVLGGYAEEMLGFNDRLFLTGALRIDGASAFGRDFEAAVYPKLGASWLLSAEPFMPRVPGLDELRLRYALGASGQQPDPAWARPGFRVQQMDLNGQRVNRYQNTGLGNPALRPERVREHEFGFDASVFASRLTLDVTWFRRRTTDQLFRQAGPPGLGDVYHNLGLTTQRGFEARLEARVLTTRPVSLDLAVQHSNYATRLVDIGSGSMLRSTDGGYVEGYPLGARFGQAIVGWEDRNSDGILVSSELMLTDTAVYMGESRPPRAQTLSAVLGLHDRRVRVSALLDRRSGFTQVDPVTCRGFLGFVGCREAVDRSTPLEAQAQTWAVSIFSVPQPAKFVRLREVTVAVDLPQRVLRLVGLRLGTLVVSGRNLALWTDFTGADPEVGNPNRTFVSAGNVAGGNAEGIPLGRVFSFRLDIGL